MVNKQRIIEELRLRATGRKEWYDGMKCPFCGRSKFGVALDGVGSFNCYRKNSCGVSGTLYDLLKKIGRLDLYEKRNYIKVSDRLDIPEPTVVELDCAEIEYPFGFRNVGYGGLRYLNDRGWTNDQYAQFTVGKCADPKYKGYIIFCLYEDDKLVGFLGRTEKSKEWHDKNPKIPRYNNARDVDFGKIIGGYDDLDEMTKQVIIVEGIMDKTNIDRILLRYSWNKRDVVCYRKSKCVFTNGAKLSEIQAKKLKRKGIREAIIMYDNGATKETQKAALLLSQYIPRVYVADIKGTADPGDFTVKDFENVMQSRLYSPIEYSVNKLKI